ncbi:hypothetical protein COOONC_19416 [Cooperia oncophora]
MLKASRFENFLTYLMKLVPTSSTSISVCEHPWQTHEQNILASYSQCSEFQDHGVRCTPHDPIECTGRNPVCIFSKQTNDYRCCSDVPQDLSNPPGIPEQVKPICPYGFVLRYSSWLLCESDRRASACPEEYTCEQAVNHQMLVTYNMHLCARRQHWIHSKTVRMFYETKVGINKMSANLSMPLFYVTSISPSIIPHAPLRGIDYVVLNEHSATTTNIPPEIRTGDHFSMLPYRFRKPVYLKKVGLSILSR